jgi:hypothetical protein
LSIPTKLIKFTCSGEGLYKDLPKKFFTPKTTKAESKPKEVGKKPVVFWKARCAFGGLNQTRAINDLQLRLREASQKITPRTHAQHVF